MLEEARSDRLLPQSRATIAAAAVLLSGGIYGLSLLDPGHGDSILFLLVMPLLVGAVAYGLRGGIGVGIVCGSLTTGWWFENSEPGGIPWPLSRSLACLTVGVVLGWFIDSRHRLLLQIEEHTELSLDLIATANFDGYFTKVNPAFTRTLGYSAEDMFAKPFLDFVHPDDRDATVEAAAAQTEAGLEVINFQNRYRTKDGSYRWLEWTSRPDPRTQSLIAVAREITDRKRLEDREHRYQEALEQAVRERTAELEKRTRDLEQARLETLQRLAIAAEYRDDATHAHTKRVAHISRLLAEALGLSERDQSLIEQAAPLHDIGKLAIPDAILLKPGRLTREEYEEMKRHAGLGAAILSGSGSHVLQLAEEIALTHHEWWNGDGYPAGLQAEAIPVCGRIVALADVFDALTHPRPYKPAWSVDQALAEIRRLSGLQFDPRVADALQSLDLPRLTRDDQRHLTAVA